MIYKAENVSVCLPGSVFIMESCAFCFVYSRELGHCSFQYGPPRKIHGRCVLENQIKAKSLAMICLSLIKGSDVGIVLEKALVL